MAENDLDLSDLLNILKQQGVNNLCSIYIQLMASPYIHIYFLGSIIYRWGNKVEDSVYDGKDSS